MILHLDRFRNVQIEVTGHARIPKGCQRAFKKAAKGLPKGAANRALTFLLSGNTIKYKKEASKAMPRSLQSSSDCMKYQSFILKNYL
jgi:hypothetical protein